MLYLGHNNNTTAKVKTMAFIDENNNIYNTLCGCGVMQVFSEEGMELCPECDDSDDYEDDGQPDEAQEWYDYDPDC